MKESIKKLTVAVCAAAITAMISTVAVTAAETARPMPDSSGTTTTQTMNTSSGETGETAAVTATQAPVTNNVVNTANNVTTSSETSNKKYQSRLGGFLWFLLSVVVNFILSCWIGNRFYKLARKSNQSSAEIRALRKDIEEKFSSTLKDI